MERNNLSTKFILFSLRHLETNWEWWKVEWKIFTFSNKNLAQGSLSDRFHSLFVFSLQSHDLFSSKIKLKNVIDSFWVLCCRAFTLLEITLKWILSPLSNSVFFRFEIWIVSLNYWAFCAQSLGHKWVLSSWVVPLHSWRLTELLLHYSNNKISFHRQLILCKSCYLMEKWLLTWDMNSLAYCIPLKSYNKFRELEMVTIIISW